MAAALARARLASGTVGEYEDVTVEFGMATAWTRATS